VFYYKEISAQTFLFLEYIMVFLWSASIVVKIHFLEIAFLSLIFQGKNWLQQILDTAFVRENVKPFNAKKV